MSRKKTKVIACADCGAEKPNEARGLCKNCYQRRARVGDTCRNGHLIATKDDLIDTCRGGVTCRECRRETQAAYDRKRAGKPPRDCPRCGCSTWLPALCRDCREAA